MVFTQVKDPAGNVYQYGYTADVFGAGRARLASATLPERATDDHYLSL